MKKQLFLLIMLSQQILSQTSILKYPEFYFPRYFDPISPNNSTMYVSDMRLNSLIYPSLFSIDQTGKMINYIVNNYVIEDDGLRVYLKNSIKWSDGGSLTSKDIEATFNFIKNSSNFLLRNKISVFKSIKTINEYELKFLFNPIYISSLSERDIVSCSDFKIIPWYKISQIPLKVENVAGFGPYILKKYDNLYLEFEVNNNYKAFMDNKPSINKIQCHIIPAKINQIESFLSCSLNFLPDIGDLDIIKLPRNKSFRIIQKPELSFYYIGFNFLRNGLFRKHAEIRKAIIYGFNKQNVVDRIYMNLGDLVAGPFPKGCSYAFSEIQPEKYDKEKAIHLLESVGFNHVDQDKIRYNGNTKLSFTLQVQAVNNGNAPINRVIQAFKRDMKEIGINIIVNYYAKEEIEKTNSPEEDLVLDSRVLDFSCNIRDFFHRKMNTNGLGYSNNLGYDNDRVNVLLEQLYGHSTAETQRLNIAYKLQIELQNDPPCDFLWTLKQISSINSCLINVENNITPTVIFDYIDEWKINKTCDCE